MLRQMTRKTIRIYFFFKILVALKRADWDRNQSR